MDFVSNIAREDRAIGGTQQDRLDRGPFVTSLARSLVHDIKDGDGNLTARRATGFVIGLTGVWGLGKSSVLKLLQLELSSMSNVIVTTFNPWLFNGRDELVRAYFNLLREAMGRSKAENRKELVRSLDRYWSAIDWTGKAVAAYADVHGGAGKVTKAWGFVSNGIRVLLRAPKEASPEEDRKALEAKIAASNCAIVVLIDELDRVEDEEVRAVAQLIKAVGEIRGISYLVAYDPGRVADALGKGRNPDEIRTTGEAYLEKIIQYAIPLRPLFPGDIDALLNAGFIEYNLVLPEPNEEQQLLLTTMKRLIRTPRDVKRLMGSFATLHAILGNEIAFYDVLSYSWLIAKAPTLRDAIASELEQMVDDPGDEEMASRVVSRLQAAGGRNEPPSVTAVLGEQAAQHEPVIRMLFPRFAEETQRRQTQSEPVAADRLSKRRNLIRALYLGNPPEMVTRSEVQAAWLANDSASLTAFMTSADLDRQLRDLISGVEELLPELPPSGDVTFWPLIAETIVRAHDWVWGPEESRWVADDATATLLRFGAASKPTRERVQHAINALIAAGDLIIVPGVIRKNLFALGMTKHSQARGGDATYEAEELARLLESEIPRYRAAVLEGTALRRLPNVEAIYVLGNLNCWDDELRSSFTSQLNSVEALTTYAALVVPPGYSADRDSLEQFFDGETISARLDAIFRGPPPVLDDWLMGCLRRLRAILLGRDPDFDPDVGQVEA
ncbi:KAP family NTPase [Rhizorhabdus sp. FW153]|uniref:KAP family NTPase n=1 Tax=Rhizorhabdus sp. FW153 TaxID=3400216 RepID=UPI003CE72EA7